MATARVLQTCTKEPSCQDPRRARPRPVLGLRDGNLDPGEDCDDGNLVDLDGCSSKCKVEGGFACPPATAQDSSTCKSGSGQCLELPIPTVTSSRKTSLPAGTGLLFPGHEEIALDFAHDHLCSQLGRSFQGQRLDRTLLGNRAANLFDGKPQPGTTTTCACQFSDWNIGNARSTSPAATPRPATTVLFPTGLALLAEISARLSS